MTLATFLAARTDAMPDIAVLQPADPFLEAAGEDLRRRIFITENAGAQTLCLRPEFTIPICARHVETDATPQRYGYEGMVFRQGRSGADEFGQAGLEDLGAADAIEADARVIIDMVEALAALGIAEAHVTLGDQAIFERVVASLKIPPRHAQRFARAFGDDAALKRAFDELRAPRPLEGLDEEATRLAEAEDADALAAYVAEQMQAANLSPLSGRSPTDIARRTIERVQDSAFALDAESADALAGFLSADVNLSQGVEALQHRARDTKIDLGDALDAFARRAALLADMPKGVTLGYNAELGRKLDYYTGVVFEARLFGADDAVAGGGRYDRLCTLLGASTPAPAIGFSISLDRVPGSKNV